MGRLGAGGQLTGLNKHHLHENPGGEHRNATRLSENITDATVQPEGLTLNWTEVRLQT